MESRPELLLQFISTNFRKRQARAGESYIKKSKLYNVTNCYLHQLGQPKLTLVEKKQITQYLIQNSLIGKARNIKLLAKSSLLIESLCNEYEIAPEDLGLFGQSETNYHMNEDSKIEDFVPLVEIANKETTTSFKGVALDNERNVNKIFEELCIYYNIGSTDLENRVEERFADISSQLLNTYFKS